MSSFCFRTFLQNALQRLLMSDLKYCQADNVEHQFWKILYYNFIEALRKSFSQVTPEVKTKVVNLINIIIEEGNTYFENLVHTLEKCYKFNIDDYINDNHVLPPKGLGYVGLALVSVQKLYVFLGDLARYKELVNETNNYAKSKLWYTKAQQINPKNGRPYNQLAILAIYSVSNIFKCTIVRNLILSLISQDLNSFYICTIFFLFFLSINL